LNLKRRLSLTKTSLQTKMSDPLVVMPLDWDASRLVVTDPVLTTFKGEDKVTEITQCNSHFQYLDDDNVPRDFCVPLPTQRTFGFSYAYKHLKPQTEEWIDGMQVSYPCTSLQTAAKPTDEEAAVLQIFKDIQMATVNKAREEAKKKPCLLPASTKNSFRGAEEEGDWNLFVKPLIDYPNVKDTKKKDTTKPLRGYFKLLTTGKGAKLRCLTRVYGPGDELVSPLKYLSYKDGPSRQGDITPAVKWQKIYWGPCGPESPCGASVKTTVIECNYAPAAAFDPLPKHRIVGKNEAEKVEEEEEFSVVTPAKAAPRGQKPQEFAQPSAAELREEKDVFETPLDQVPVVTATKAPVAAKAKVAKVSPGGEGDASQEAQNTETPAPKAKVLKKKTATTKPAAEQAE
jgi:hypothetical protein